MRRHIEEPGEWIRDAFAAADKERAAVAEPQKQPTDDAVPPGTSD
jgi:hypothetical protein